jgi:trehalose 6-phosphate phosphatase
LWRSPPPLTANCALFLDIDGTLLDIAPTPGHVKVDTDLAALLPALARKLNGAVALITGRAIADVDRLFPGVHLPVAGQHGCERRAADGTRHRHVPTSAAIEGLRTDLRRIAGHHPALLLEDKGLTLALHYRRAPHLGAYVHQAVRALLGIAATRDAALQMQPGKGVVEIKPDGRDKGTAVLEYMAERPFAGRTPVFVGDDRTDEFGFAAIERARGWAIKVGPGRTCAPFRLRDVAAVRRWLAALPPDIHFSGSTPDA